MSGVSRRASRWVLGAILVASALAGPPFVVAQEATPASPPPFRGEAYAGQTSDPDTLIAVVLAEAPTGAEERAAQVFLCDATAVAELLTGALTGNRLQLRSTTGATLEASFGDAGAIGTATLPDGTALQIEADPSAGIAGLYTAAIDDAGQLSGVSSLGGRLAGRVEAGVASPVSTSAFGSELTMTVTPSEGEAAEITARSTVVAEGTFRLILLADGRGRGCGTTADGEFFGLVAD